MSFTRLFCFTNTWFHRPKIEENNMLFAVNSDDVQ